MRRTFNNSLAIATLTLVALTTATTLAKGPGSSHSNSSGGTMKFSQMKSTPVSRVTTSSSNLSVFKNSTPKFDYKKSTGPIQIQKSNLKGTTIYNKNLNNAVLAKGCVPGNGNGGCFPPKDNCKDKCHDNKCCYPKCHDYCWPSFNYGCYYGGCYTTPFCGSYCGSVIEVPVVVQSPVVVEKPVLVQQTSATVEVVQTELPKVAVGSTITLRGESFGQETGRVALKSGELILAMQVVKWDAKSATITVPQIGLAGAAEAKFLVLRADGSLASEIGITLVPAAAPAGLTQN